MRDALPHQTGTSFDHNGSYAEHQVASTRNGHKSLSADQSKAKTSCARTSLLISSWRTTRKAEACARPAKIS